eukprot:4787255-Amphidinium_carterae.1
MFKHDDGKVEMIGSQHRIYLGFLLASTCSVAFILFSVQLPFAQIHGTSAFRENIRQHAIARVQSFGTVTRAAQFHHSEVQQTLESLVSSVSIPTGEMSLQDMFAQLLSSNTLAVQVAGALLLLGAVVGPLLDVCVSLKLVWPLRLSEEQTTLLGASVMPN